MEMPDWRVEEFAAIDSTQDELRRRLNQGQEIDQLVIRAAVQTRGRGQRARDWESARGGSYQSVALKGFALPASSLFMAIGVVKALNAGLPATRLKLKWPNDIHLADGTKVAGILCEYTQGHLFVGVGVNVANRPPQGAASVTELELGEVNERVLAGIAAGWQNMHFKPDQLAEEYALLDSLHGRRLRFDRGGREYEGIASGVDVAGRLRLRTLDGERLVDSATTLRPAPED